MKYITYNGETLSLTEWAKKYNIQRNTLYTRLRAGLSLEEALNMPPRHNLHLFTIKELNSFLRQINKQIELDDGRFPSSKQYVFLVKDIHQELDKRNAKAEIFTPIPTDA